MIIKNYLSICLISICSFISIESHAQLRCDWRNKTDQLLKVNLLNFPLKTFNLEYERLLKPQASWGINAVFTPERDLPFKKKIIENIEDENGIKTLNDLRLNQFSIIPFMKFYFGNNKPFTKFYVSPYIKYTRYTSSLDLYYQYLDISNPLEQKIVDVEIPLKATINSLSLGAAIGFQFNVFKNLYIDWKIIGNHYGILFGDGSGHSTSPLTPEMQEDIKQDIESINDFPLYKFTPTVTATDLEVKAKGANIGVTSSLSIGFKF